MEVEECNRNSSSSSSSSSSVTTESDSGGSAPGPSNVTREWKSVRRPGAVSRRHTIELESTSPFHGFPGLRMSDKPFDAGPGQRNGKKSRKLTLKDRLEHFTWTWFTMTMATGGIANVLYNIPHAYRFKGLYELGSIFFLLNIALFIFNVTMISLRFHFYPYTFRSSLTHPTESLFSPALVISFGTILINITQYGIDGSREWLGHVMIIMYWIDCALAVLFSTGIYLMIWSTTTYTIAQMTPVWIFPAYPLLIIGTHAGQLAAKVSPSAALDIIVGGFVLQGIGFLVSLMVYSAFLYRLMTQKLPKESTRPGMFISVGPSGFTIVGLISMGQILPKIVPPDFMLPGNGEFVAKVSLIVANWVGIWLWGLALWFFLVSIGAHFNAATHGRMQFAMTWYSFIFPNTALTSATFSVARALDENHAIIVLGLVMTVALVLTWLFVAVMMVRAVLKRQILWPQKDQDRDEGGWNGLERQATWEGRKRFSLADIGRIADPRNKEKQPDIEHNVDRTDLGADPG